MGLKPGFVVSPPQGDALDALRKYRPDLKIPADLLPDQRLMLDAMVKAHVLDELAVRPGLAMIGQGHLSPAVILREHNRLVSMPEGYEPIKKIFRQLRGWERGDNTAGLIKSFFPSFTYGEGPRLSRGHIRHMSEIMNLRAVAQQMIMVLSDYLYSVITSPDLEKKRWK